MITQRGLKELIENINKTTYMAYKQPFHQQIENKEVEEEEEVEWDPQNPHQYKFKILADYLDLYKKIKEETPELLELEQSKVRKFN